MLEIPESTTIAKQLNKTVFGKTICNVIANSSPHKFAFYQGDLANYNTLLSGQVVGESFGIGAMIEIFAGDRRIFFGDGANLRYYDDSVKASPKHQLLLEFTDRSILVCSIQMYCAVLVFIEGTNNSKYYLIAREKPSPINDSFDIIYI